MENVVKILAKLRNTLSFTLGVTADLDQSFVERFIPTDPIDVSLLIQTGQLIDRVNAAYAE